MAVWNFEDFEGAPADTGGQVQRAVHLAGAAISLALVVGVAVWGYRLAMRDVHGIPVIEAMSGPMRIAPEDPGGQIAANVGLSVNGIAAGNGTAQAPTDNITLAPGAVALNTADVSPEARQAALDAAQAAANKAAAQKQADQQAALAAAPAADGVNSAGTNGAADMSAVDGTAPNGTAQNATAADQANAAPPVTIEGKSILPNGPPAQSPAPQPRPSDVPMQVASASAAAPSAADSVSNEVAAAAAAAAAAVSAAPPAPATVDASKLSAGTRLVQLGAFPDARDAEKDWAALQSQFPDLMADKSRVVQKAEAGGRAFYRLRAYGFKDDAESRRFCAAMKAEGASCVPVQLR